MRLSFEDQESLKEAAGSLCFNNLPSDPNIRRMGSSSSMSPHSLAGWQGQERSEESEDI